MGKGNNDSVAVFDGDGMWLQTGAQCFICGKKAVKITPMEDRFTLETCTLCYTRYLGPSSPGISLIRQLARLTDISRAAAKHKVSLL